MRNEFSKKYMPVIIFFWSVVATLMIFAPALSYNEVSVTGVEIAFGTDLAEDFIQGELELNSYAVVAYFSPLAAGLLTLIMRQGNMFSLAMFVLAAVLFFLMPNYIEVVNNGGEVANHVDWNHSFGVILAAFASVLAALGEMLHISMEDMEGNY